MTARTTAPPATLRERLRKETAAEHARVEAAADLARALASPGGYARFLGALWAVYKPAEAAVGAFGHRWAAIGIDIGARRRVHRLEADLDALGRPGRRPSAVRVPIAGFDEAVGCAYVLEGATLGAGVIRRRLERSRLDVPSAFLSGYGDRTPAMWRAFCVALDRHEDSGGDAERALTGARATFSALGAAFTAA